MPTNGIHSVTVPARWMAGQLLRRFGASGSRLCSLPLFVMPRKASGNRDFSSYWAASVRKLRRDRTPSHLPAEGHAPRPGELFRNPDLAWSLQQIARQGRNAFYEGGIAKRILAGSKALGGTMTADDLASFSAEWVEPISTSYRAMNCRPTAGNRRVDHAQPDGTFPSRRKVRFLPCAARDDRSQEARLRRYAPLRLRP